MVAKRWSYLLLARALIVAEAAKSLQKVSNRSIIAIQNAQVPEPFVSLNQSLTTSNSSIDNRIDIVCDPLIYGASLNLGDCVEALNFLITSDIDYTWVNRRTGHSGMMFQLPFRIMGSKLVDIFRAAHLADTRYSCRDLLPPANAKIQRRRSPCKL